MNNRLRHLSAALVLTLALALSGCTFPTAYHAAAPAPCMKPVGPISNAAITVIIADNFSYNAQNPSMAKEEDIPYILNRLNADGQADGNTFSQANGVQPNFYLTYTTNNDGNNHFSGTLLFSGWGDPFIANFGSGQYTYANSADMLNNLTDQAYAYIHLGWHDSRPSCPQN